MKSDTHGRTASEAQLDLEEVKSFRKLYQEMPVGQLLEIRESHKPEDFVPEARKALQEVMSIRKTELDRERRELNEEAKHDQKPGADSRDSLVLDTGTVFNRTAQNSRGKAISPIKYNLIIGLVLGWGALVNWLIVKAVSFEAWDDISRLVFLIVYCGSCYLGIYLFTKSRKPLVSFIGYNLVVVPLGAVVDMIFQGYDPSIVLETVKITGLVIATMMVLGSRFPELFKRIETPLFFSLLFVVIWEIADLLILRITHEPADWIVALVFCGYIGWDWGRANRIPKTVDNAIDSAAALYMDFINLCVRILEMLDRKEKKPTRPER